MIVRELVLFCKWPYWRGGGGALLKGTFYLLFMTCIYNYLWVVLRKHGLFKGVTALAHIYARVIYRGPT